MVMLIPMVVGLPRADGLSDDDGVLVPETHLICGIQIRMVVGFRKSLKEFSCGGLILTTSVWDSPAPLSTTQALAQRALLHATRDIFVTQQSE